MDPAEGIVGKHATRPVLHDAEGGGLGTFAPYGLIQGATPGPSAAGIAGADGNEVASQDGAEALWRRLTPDDVYATPTGCQGRLHATLNVSGEGGR